MVTPPLNNRKVSPNKLTSNTKFKKLTNSFKKNRKYDGRMITPAMKNEKVPTHEDPSKKGIKGFRCSTFIDKEKVLVKGERDNEQQEKRNAMIVLFDCARGKVSGGSGARN